MDGVLTPAYGRDYINQNMILKDWNLNRDFIFHNPVSRYDGKYINKSDAEQAGLLNLQFRYNKQQLVAVLENRNGTWKWE